MAMKHPSSRRMKLTCTLAILITVGAGSFTAAPAFASSNGADRAESALTNLGILGSTSQDADRSTVQDSSESVGTGSSIDLARGLVIPARGEVSELTVAPAADLSQGFRGGSGIAVYSTSPSFDYAISDSSTGPLAGYSVSYDESAPTEYGYEINVGGLPAVLELSEQGTVSVTDVNGIFTNLIQPAWALDAAGNAVPTSYSIDGNVLIQHVTHQGAQYPVVADPSLSCDGLWCTVNASRSETAAIADNALNLGWFCTFVNVGAAACALSVGGAWAVANVARNNGVCVGYRFWQASPLVWNHWVTRGC